MELSNYYRNGFILFLTPLVFNTPFTSKLPLNYLFPKEASQILEILEIFFRIIVVISPFIPIILYQDNVQFKSGLIVYLFAIVLYFISWILLIAIDIGTINNLNPVLRAMIVFVPSYTPITGFVE